MGVTAKPITQLCTICKGVKQRTLDQNIFIFHYEHKESKTNTWQPPSKDRYPPLICRKLIKVKLLSVINIPSQCSVQLVLEIAASNYKQLQASQFRTHK